MSKVFCEVDSGSDVEDGVGSGSGNSGHGQGSSASQSQKKKGAPDDSGIVCVLPIAREAGNLAPSKAKSTAKLVLNVKPIKKRQLRANTKDAERKMKLEAIRQGRFDDEEQTLVREAFEDEYPKPPSNMLAAGRYELAKGKEMSAELTQLLWDADLKPWTEKWWRLSKEFVEMMREFKSTKPVTKSTRVTKQECARQAKRFHRENGNARKDRTAEEDRVAFAKLEKKCSEDRSESK